MKQYGKVRYNAQGSCTVGFCTVPACVAVVGVVCS